MTTTQSDWKVVVAPRLEGINKYNPENIDTLQKYLLYQSASGVYDFEANLSLLKLYQFHPHHFDAELTILILLKALMNLPATDFVLLKCVLPQDYPDDKKMLSKVMSLHEHLESCHFKQFWESYTENQEMFANVVGFKEAIVSYIVGIINGSFQTISDELLKNYLGESNDTTLASLAQSQGWVKSGSQWSIKNQEEFIKPKKIISKIEFDSVAGILTS
ncbi:eukaryotic translation initiation factor 3 subunit K-like [Dysidea avara]|uniref:eukaryotic translation initiation factor 3 subunit K-like n=1 Tax=Dysidea avara TaxID=196820 RepID=UPI003331B7E8